MRARVKFLIYLYETHHMWTFWYGNCSQLKHRLLCVYKRSEAALLQKHIFAQSNKEIPWFLRKIVEKWKTNLMSLAILFHFLCAQHVSDINISIFRSLRLCCWITTSVVLFSVRCVLDIWCGWFWVVFVLQAEAQLVLLQAEAQVVLQPAKVLQLLQWCTVQ